MDSQINTTASSSSSISPTSISKDKYDVFLSFSWEDIGKSFADHLYGALARKGLHSFREATGKPESKEAIASESLMAIEKSKVFIVIFSKNYARSRYNLDELVKIMECTQATGNVVVPVFYHVDPSDVRKQKRSYEEAFYNHDAKQEKETIDNWRSALTNASNLSGYVLDHGRYESTIIKEITDSVFGTLEHVYPGDNLVGIDSHLEELKSLIGIGSDDVRMLGVWGLGGIGKTTIGKVIYNLISYQFDGACFLQMAREQSIIQLQRRLLIDITGMKDENLNNDVDEGTTEINKRLQQKKVLIFFDDVDSLRQLKCLVPDRDWLGRGSRIIIMTRNRHLLYAYGVDAVYEVQGLGFEESMLLFSLCAFRQRFPEEGYVELSRYMVNYANGHPLTLKVLGHFLYRKTISEWESALDKLKCRPMPTIQSVLQISYDRLDEISKHIFLDIACFFNGEESEFVSRISDSAEIAIRDLYNRSLVTFSNNKILMHPLLQQMGQEVVYQESPKKRGRRSRLWRSEDVHYVLSRNTGTRKIEGIFLNTSASKPIEFTTEAFKRMTGLRLLKVSRDVKCDSIVKTCEVHVPADFEFHCYDLSYLHWDDYPLESLPLNFHGKNLIELNLQYSKLRRLWRGCKRHKKLKVVNLSHSQQLIQIPDFTDTPNLENLILEGCTSLENLPEVWGNQWKLRYLNLAFCKNLESLPYRFWGLDSLVKLDLSHCSKLQELPTVRGNRCKLEYLNLAFCKNLESLPYRFWDLDSLVKLDLSHCSKLQELPEVRENLYSLEYLNLAFCKKLKSLPENLCNLKYLKTLNVIGCSKLGRLPESLGGLECLEKLCASNAYLISPEFHYSLAGLCSLKILDAHGTCLTKGAIRSDIGSLYSLEELDLSYCNLTDGGIPDDISCLYSLRVLDLSGNHFLRVTYAISQLSKLRVLRLRHCKNLVVIPELPSSLRVLDAHGCKSMETSSSSSLSPLRRQLNCFKSAVLEEIQELKYSSLLSLPANGVNQGFSTFIPGSGKVPEWISHQNVGSEVTAELPQNWYDNKDFLGFSLCCVYIPQQDEPESSAGTLCGPGKKSAPRSSRSKNTMVNITQPYRLGCGLTFLDDESGFLDDLSYESSCQRDHNDGVSDSVWVTYYSNVAIKKKCRSDTSRHFKASFNGHVHGKPVKVEKCGIGLVYI